MPIPFVQGVYGEPLRCVHAHCVSVRVCIQAQRYKGSLISHSASVRQHNRSQIKVDNLSHEHTTMPEA